MKAGDSMKKKKKFRKKTDWNAGAFGHFYSVDYGIEFRGFAGNQPKKQRYNRAF